MWGHTGRDRPDFAVVPGPGQESVWDYPRPPIARRCNRLVEVRDGDVIVASTTRSIRLMETASPPTYYIPPGDLVCDALVETSGSSVCEWKGAARYWALARKPDTAIAWDYLRPRARFSILKCHLAFYPGRIACFVDGERVQAQPGRFYGGWITKDVVGPFKGEPGTLHW